MMSNIFMEVMRERVAQDDQWGGRNHDDKHRATDWFAFIEQQLGKSHVELMQGREANVVVRARLVKIAALAFAGIESIDRKEAP